MRLSGLVACFVTVAAASAETTTERVESLGRDPFQADETDVFRFPGLASVYADTLVLEFSPSPLDGSAFVLVHRPWTIGLAGHRPPQWDDMAEVTRLFGVIGGATPMDPVVDLIGGYGWNEHGFGLLLGISAGLQTSEDVWNGRGVTGRTALAIDLALGHSIDIPGYRGDSGLTLSFRHARYEFEDTTMTATDGIPSFALTHRSLIGPDTGVRLGIDVLLTRRWYGFDLSTDAGPVEVAMSRWLTRVTVGPHADVAAGVTLSGGVAFGYEWLGGDSAGVRQDEESGVLAPGIIASMEAEVASWLVARAGIAYSLVLATHMSRDAGNPQTEERHLEHGFSWSVGLGLRWDRFRVDGMISPDLFYTGPAIVGGGNPRLFSQVSAALEF